MKFEVDMTARCPHNTVTRLRYSHTETRTNSDVIIYDMQRYFVTLFIHLTRLTQISVLGDQSWVRAGVSMQRARRQRQRGWSYKRRLRDLTQRQLVRSFIHMSGMCRKI